MISRNVALLLGLVSLALAGCSRLHRSPQEMETSEAAPAARIRVVDGEDWSLPPWAPERSPHGGFYQIWGSSVKVPADVVDIPTLGPQIWRLINPAEGTYDFKRLHAEGRFAESYLGLDRIRESGRKGLLWMPIMDATIGWEKAPAVPQWVLDRYDVPFVRAYRHADKRKGDEFTNAGIYAVWEDGPRRELARAIREIGKRYRDDPAFGYAYICTVRNGGEFSIHGGHARRLEEMGYSAAQLGEFFKFLIDTWVEALGPGKCIWEPVGTWPGYYGVSEAFTQRWQAMNLDVCRHAMARGVGQRLGLGECLGEAIRSHHLLRLTWDKDGHLASQPLPVAFFGNELEEERNMLNDYMWFKLSTLSCLAHHHTHIMYGDTIYNLPRQPDNGIPYDSRFVTIRDYCRATLGYAPEQSPDAWCALREMSHRDRVELPPCPEPFTPSPNAAPTVKPPGSRIVNLEHFLYQCDLEGGRTVPARKHVWRYSDEELRLAKGHPAAATSNAGNRRNRLKGTAVHFLPRDMDYTWEARQTDVANGNRFMAFQVDRRFLGAGTHDVAIHITYEDTGRAEWALEYTGSSPRTAGTVHNTGTNRTRTAVFRVRDLTLGHHRPENADFRIAAGGSEDAVVTFVRVLRLSPPPE